jgi:cobalt-zinc-cadmium efflux system membrane fusion protein
MSCNTSIARPCSAGILLLASIPAFFTLLSCGNVHAQGNGPADGLPPAPRVVPFGDAALFSVDHPEQYPVATATAHATPSELVVTGTVTPDVSRQVPVPSLASGRIVEIDARLGDEVKKGQLLFKVRSQDIAGAYANYQQAVKNEELTKLQLDRAIKLVDAGAYPKSQLEIAQNAEDTNVVILNATKEQLSLMGVDPAHPTGIVSYEAPVAGTITDQEITKDAAVQSYSMPAPFTISDLSNVWVVCDVYENDLAAVKLGDTADITLNAFPGRVLKGKVSNFLPILDPNIRTGKVRIEVQNPGFMRLGMFVTATFRGQTVETHTIVPAAAVMHLHDRDFVFEPAPGGKFRRVEIVSGDVLNDNTSLQEIKSGLKPGDQVITNALVLDHVLGEKN